MLKKSNETPYWIAADNTLLIMKLFICTVQWFKNVAWLMRQSLEGVKLFCLNLILGWTLI